MCEHAKQRKILTTKFRTCVVGAACAGHAHDKLARIEVFLCLGCLSARRIEVLSWSHEGGVSYGPWIRTDVASFYYDDGTVLVRSGGQDRRCRPSAEELIDASAATIHPQQRPQQKALTREMMMGHP